MKYFIAFILATTLTSFIGVYNNNHQNRRPANLGIFPDVEKLSEDHLLEHKTTALDIEKFIEYTSYDDHLCNDHYRDDFSKVNDRNSSNIISKQDLANEIFNLSDCFNIDAGIYAALIYKESQFCNFGGSIYHNLEPIITSKSRLSTTGAGGLTMFTGIARKDIYDQLYNQNRKYFHYKARPKIHNMMAKCHYASGHSFTVDEYYKYKPWLNDSIYNSHNITSKELKKPHNWKKQLLFGAIKLKILLSLRAQPDDFKATNNVNHYYKVLRKYNGAGGTQENEYWQFIFAAYNDYFDSSFEKTANAQGYKFNKIKWNKTLKVININKK